MQEAKRGIDGGTEKWRLPRASSRKKKLEGEKPMGGAARGSEEEDDGLRAG